MNELNIDLLLGETITVEYKDDNYDHFSDSKIIEGAVAMANSAGGRILIGVSDKGEVKGSRRLGNQWISEKTIESIIQQNTRPCLITDAEILFYNGLKVISVKVPISTTTVGTTSGKFLKRRLDSRGSPVNLPMTAEEIAGKVSVIGSTDFSANYLFNCSLDAIDLNLVDELAKKILKQNQLTRDEKELSLFSQTPKDILQGLGLLNSNEAPNIAGLLLFGKKDFLRERIPQAFVQFQVFSSKSEILKNERFDGPIVKLIPLILEQAELNQNSDEFTFRGSSVTIPEYASDALREAIANALVHRDYTYPNSIQIQVYSNEIVITSPGGFPQGVTLDRLLSVAPTPRNRRLSEALYRLKFIESSGRGIDFIYYGQARYGRPAPDYQGSTPESVSVRLNGGKANLDFCKLLLSVNDNLTINEMLLLNAMYMNRDVTLSEASTILQSYESRAKEVLMNMHKDGLVEYVIQEEERFFLKGSISPFARQVTSPKRLTKAELIQFSELIRNELKRKKTVSKADLADAVGLSEPQCYRLLRDLSQKGKVVQTKDKKWKLV